MFLMILFPITLALKSHVNISCPAQTTRPKDYCQVNKYSHNYRFARRCYLLTRSASSEEHEISIMLVYFDLLLINTWQSNASD
jgi:hypothetical protein